MYEFNHCFKLRLQIAYGLKARDELSWDGPRPSSSSKFLQQTACGTEAGVLGLFKVVSQIPVFEGKQIADSILIQIISFEYVSSW